MSIYKRHHLLKSAFTVTVVGLLLACFACYKIGYNVAQDKITRACVVAIDRAERSCVD